MQSVQTSMRSPAQRASRWTLALILVSMVFVLGSQAIDATWIQGDEQMFIAGNALVTGSDGTSLIERLPRIFGTVHNDLYQPIPIASYAIEWQLWGDSRIGNMRRTDVAIHALNAVLVWLAVATLLRATTPGASAANIGFVSWVLALLWAAHPALAPAYAADMGRTHLLAATFLLASLLCHLRGARSGATHWSAATIALLIAAMLCKVTPGWFAIVLLVEALVLGWPRAIRSPRVWGATAICVGFSVLAYRTTRQAGLMEDASLALFGGPIERSLVGVWYYLRTIFFPIDLSTWNLADTRTSWSYWPTWVGAAAVIVSAVAIFRGVSVRAVTGATIGLIWFWAAIGPLLGVVGARVAASQDRYLYLPLIGLLLIIGSLLLRSLRDERAVRAAAIGIAAIASALALISMTDVRDARSTLRRAERVVQRYPGDPRALELLAIAFDYTAAHQTAALATVPIDELRGRFLDIITQAAQAAETRSDCFRDKADRAAFHRRISWQFLGNRMCDRSLQQAERAADFEPDHPMTLTRLAHAYRCLGQFDRAVVTYERLERVLPKEPAVRAMRLTEFGDVLLFVFNSPQHAMPRYRAAVETGAAPTRAKVGLARCEVLVGQGSAGLDLASMVIAAEPDNVDAMLVVALYQLRSHKWQEAEQAYRMILAGDPTHYEALRCLHEVVAQSGRWIDAAEMWERAMQVAPDVPAYRAYAAWAAACAGHEAARTWIDELLAADANHVFACLSEMLLSLRKDDLAAAMEWIERAAKGRPIPEAREMGRAELTLRLMIAKAELPQNAVVARAALAARVGNVVVARELLTSFLASATGEPRAIASKLLESLPATPAIAPAGAVPESASGPNGG